MKLCHQELSKVAQTGHTAVVPHILAASVDVFVIALVIDFDIFI